MENQRKWVLLSYAAFAALVSYVVWALLTKAAGAYEWESKLKNADLLVQGVSVGLGLILFVYLFRHTKVNQFMDEVVAELSRVTWPTQSDTSKATVVVLVMVLISGMILGFLDWVWTKALGFVL